MLTFHHLMHNSSLKVSSIISHLLLRSSVWHSSLSLSLCSPSSLALPPKPLSEPVIKSYEDFGRLSWPPSQRTALLKSSITLTKVYVPQFAHRAASFFRVGTFLPEVLASAHSESARAREHAFYSHICTHTRLRFCRRVNGLFFSQS